MLEINQQINIIKLSPAGQEIIDIFLNGDGKTRMMCRKEYVITKAKHVYPYKPQLLQRSSLFNF